MIRQLHQVFLEVYNQWLLGEFSETLLMHIINQTKTARVNATNNQKTRPSFNLPDIPKTSRNLQFLRQLHNSLSLLRNLTIKAKRAKVVNPKLELIKISSRQVKTILNTNQHKKQVQRNQKRTTSFNFNPPTLKTPSLIKLKDRYRKIKLKSWLRMNHSFLRINTPRLQDLSKQMITLTEMKN